MADSNAHPDAHDGGEEANRPSAAVRLGEKHNENRVDGLAPVAPSFEREEQRDEGMQGLAGQLGNGPGSEAVGPLASVGREGQRGGPNVTFE